MLISEFRVQLDFAHEDEDACVYSVTVGLMQWTVGISSGRMGYPRLTIAAHLLPHVRKYKGDCVYRVEAQYYRSGSFERMSHVTQCLEAFPYQGYADRFPLEYFRPLLEDYLERYRTQRWQR
jgi:hypothetical protein